MVTPQSMDRGRVQRVVRFAWRSIAGACAALALSACSRSTLETCRDGRCEPRLLTVADAAATDRVRPRPSSSLATPTAAISAMAVFDGGPNQTEAGSSLLDAG